MYRRLKLRLSAALLLASAACGGGGTSPSPPGPPPPPPPPPPAPVASVTVTPNAASLVPQQTQPLVAATLDGAGNPLSGRAVTWTTSAAGVATVSSAGLVTAVGAGSATITATSETKTGTAAITVADGGQITSTGGNIDAAGGAVKVVVPGGAVAAPLAITVTAPTSLPTAPDGAWITPGSSYLFGPEGTTFTTPVAVTIKYDPAKIPAWALPGDLTLLHFTGGAWVPLTGITVDGVAHTVTGQTTSFSPIVVATNLPQVTLTPNPGLINFFQRSVTLTATVVGHPITTGITFAFTTTGDNGTVNSQGAPQFPTIQYTYTQTSMPNATVDVVQVIARAIDATGALVRLAEVTVPIQARLVNSFSTNPDFGSTGFGQPVGIDAIIRDPSGNIVTGPKWRYVWTTTTFHGNLDIAGPNMVTTKHGIYTADPIGPNTVKVPPRVDKITVDFYERHDTTVIIELNDGLIHKSVDSSNARYNRIDGTATTFIEVAPKTSLANLVIRETLTAGGSCITADAIVTVVPTATSYDLTVFGIHNSPTYPSGTAHKIFTGATHTGSILDIYSTGGGFFGVPLDGGCATTQTAIDFRKTLYHGQYDNASFVVKSTP